MTAAICRKVQGAIARDAGEPELVMLISRHLRGCPDCRTQDHLRAEIRDGVLAADDVLDDLTRTRVLARLLEGEHHRRASGGIARSWARGGRPWGGVWVGWALAVSTVMVLLVTGLRLSRRLAPDETRVPAPVALEPYAVHSSAVAGPRLGGGGLDRVELPAHASMRARLGSNADLVLVGPLDLAVRNADDKRAGLEMRRGTLIADFDGSRGRSLRVITADATVDIVGTRFLVEASPERTRVAVEHGSVRVESRGRVRLVGARQEWLTDRNQPEALGASGAELFERAARGNLEELSPEGSEAAEPPLAAAKIDRPRPLDAHAPPRKLALTETKRRPANRQLVVPPPERSPKLALRASPREARGNDIPSASGAAAPRASEATPGPRLQEARPESPLAAPPGPAPAPVVPTPIKSPALPEARPKDTAGSLYRRAESALRRGDDVAARKLLNELVRAFPDEPATDSARYELALMAEKARQTREALAQTRDILRSGARGPFVEPAQFLQCRVYLAEDRGAASACLGRFVHDFPRSPHDEVALRALMDLARQGGRCAEAKQFADTYLQRHPQGRFAAEAGHTRSHCGD